MAAKRQILFHLFMATVAVLLETTVAYEQHPENVGPAGEPTGLNVSDNHPTDGERGERKMHWPTGVTIRFRRSSQGDSDAPHTGPDAENNVPHHDGNNVGDRKFPRPSGFTVHFKQAEQAIRHPKLPETYKLDQEERLYGSVPVVVPCNHTTQAGRTCADCTHSLLCFPNNLGVKRDCGSQYCDDGRCAPQPSANCSTTTDA